MCVEVFKYFLNRIPNVGETVQVQLRVDIEYLDEGVVPDADNDDNDVNHRQARQQGVKD